MFTRDWLAVSGPQALRFFFERLKDVSEESNVPEGELLYNASMLAHFASTSSASTEDFPAAPTSLTAIFDTFVLDRSGHRDPDILEAAASQCLLLTGFFCRQVRRRHNVDWYARIGAGYYREAAKYATDWERARMMRVMAGRFEFWRYQQDRLARDLRESRLLILPNSDAA